MGFLDSIRNLTRPYDDDDDEYFDDLPEDSRQSRPSERVVSRSAPASSRQTSAYSSQYDQPRRATRSENVIDIGNANGMKVALVKPERFEQAAEIADHLRDKHAVVMNLEQTQKDVARRLIDFLSGVAYARDGKIKKVANSTYIITPYNVDILGELIEGFDSSSLYF